MHMRSEEDAFGHALMAHWEGDPAISIIERSDGYFDAENVGGYFAEFSEWSAHQKKAMSFAGGRVLDLGCGAGRHALYLESRGLSVLGIDESPLAIRVCRARGLQSVKVLRATQISSALGSFETILMMGNNLGLLGGFHRAQWLLRRLERLTNNDARIIAETLNPYATQNRFHKQNRRFNRNHGRMPGQVRIRLRYQGYATPWFDYLLASRAELKRMVAGTGWQVVEFIPSDGPMYVVVLEKG
jgi:SAM-dependent methyltransferase